jgi:hypothetical protein
VRDLVVVAGDEEVVGKVVEDVGVAAVERIGFAQQAQPLLDARAPLSTVRL